MAKNYTHLDAPNVHLLILLGKSVDFAALDLYRGSVFVQNFDIAINLEAELDSEQCCSVTQRGKGDYEEHLCKMITAHSHQMLEQQMVHTNVFKLDLICSRNPAMHSSVAFALHRIESAVSTLHLAFESSVSQTAWPQIATAISRCSKLSVLALEFFGTQPNIFPVLSSLSQLKEVKLFISDISPNFITWLENQMVFIGVEQNILAEGGIESVWLNCKYPVSDVQCDRLTVVSARLAASLHSLPPLAVSINKATTLLAHLRALTRLTIITREIPITMGSLVRMLAPLTNLKVLQLDQLDHDLSPHDDQLPESITLSVTHLVVSFSSPRAHSRLHSSGWGTYFSELTIIKLKGPFSPCCICSTGSADEDKQQCHLQYFKDFVTLPKLKKTWPINVVKSVHE